MKSLNRKLAPRASKKAFDTLVGTLVLASVALSLGACRPNEPPVDFSVLVPEPNTLQFEATLRGRYGLGLTGNFPIENYGSIFLRPETASSNFGFGFTLHTSVFLKESWVGYNEVTTLPTGALFPGWMTGPVVDLVIPPINTHIADWHFYFGTRGQFYMGVASVIHAIDGRFPDINIGYTFYDDQGRVVLGVQFFGPAVGGGGQLISPGGIFVGSNLTPFLPEGFQPEAMDPEDPSVGMLSSELMAASSAKSSQLRSSKLRRARVMSRALSANAMRLVHQANNHEPMYINGRSVVAEVRVSGKQKRRYRSERQIKSAINRFTAASRRR